MKIDKLNHFKLTIENVSYETINDKVVISDWTGYGLILVPYVGWKTFNRGTRKPIFVWMVGRRVYQVDVTQYLINQFINK